MILILVENIFMFISFLQVSASLKRSVEVVTQWCSVFQFQVKCHNILGISNNSFLCLLPMSLRFFWDTLYILINVHVFVRF